MSRNIKGITIEIGAETKGLDKALKGVNTSARNIQSELREVDKLLKFNPGNTELISQKQKLLAEAVSNSSEKLNTLKEAQRQVEEQFARGEIGEEQYRAIQREVLKAEQNLGSLEQQLQSVNQAGSESEKVQQALADITQESTNLQVELKEVDRLLQLDPGNTELIAQQQQLLGNEVENTKEKLNLLEEAQRQVQAQFESGEVGEEQYRSIQREIVETENRLRQYEEQIESTGNAQSTFGDRVQSVASQLSSAGDKIKSVGSSMSAKFTAPIVAGAALAVEGTRELREQLGKLETNTQMAGGNIESTNKTLRDLSGISEDSGANVEALSNLMQAGFTDDSLADVVNELGGAVIKFPDTLNIEGLADGLQETLATGAAAGSFAELLERMGVNLEDFDAGLASAAASGDEQNYVMQQLASLGLSDVNDAYRENNKALVDGALANHDMAVSMAEIGEKLEPIMNKIKQFAVAVLEGFNSLPEPVKNFILILGGILAAIGPILVGVGSLMTGVGAMGPVFTQIGTVAGPVFTAIGTAIGAITAPIALTVAAVVGLVAVGVALYKNWDTVKEKAGQLGEYISGKWNDIKQSTSDAWASVTDVISGVWSGITDVIKFAWELIKSIISSALAIIEGVIGSVMNTITYAWQIAWEALKNLLSPIWDGIKDVITGALDAIKGAVSGPVDAVKDVVVGAWTGIKDKTSEIWNSLKDVMAPIVDNIKTAISSKFEEAKASVLGVTDAIRDSVSAKFEELKSKIQGIWTNIKETISGPIENAKESVSRSVEGIKTTVNSTFSNMVGGVANVWNGVKSSITKPIEEAKRLVEKSINAIKGFFNKLQLKFPQIQRPKLPRFKIQGKLSLSPPSVPRLSVDWYKNGGIMTKPTAFGMNGSSLMAGGEAGKEAILPIEKLKGWIFEWLNKGSKDTSGSMIVSELSKISQALSNQVSGGGSGDSTQSLQLLSNIHSALTNSNANQQQGQQAVFKIGNVEIATAIIGAFRDYEKQTGNQVLL